MKQAQAELNTLVAREVQADKDFAGIVPRLDPLMSFTNRDGERLLMPVAGAVALVFLIACANAAGLMLARGLQRQHEYALRAALGARPFQICRPVLAESLMLSLLGGVIGVALSVWWVDVLKAVAGSSIPRLDQVRVGWPLGFFRWQA